MGKQRSRSLQSSENTAHEDLKSQKTQVKEVVDTTEKIGGANGTTSEEIHIKKMKKKSKRDTSVNETGKTLEGAVMNEKVNKSYMKSNGNESHMTSGHKDQSTKVSKESYDVPELVEDQSSKKQKEKKKKKSKLTSQSLDADEKPEVIESESKISLSKSSALDLLDGETTVDRKSKKRSSYKDLSTEVSKESNGVLELADDKSSKKQKEKKKKKSKLTSLSLDADEKQIEVMPVVTESEFKGSLTRSSAAELLDGETIVDKKSKKRSSHKDQSTKVSKESNGVPELVEDQSSKKQKEKKKKKSKLASQSLDVDENQIELTPEVTESEYKGSLSKSSALLDEETTVERKSKKRSFEAAEDGINESKKTSKKRKIMIPNESESQSGQEVAVESKSKTSKVLDEGKDALQQKGETFEAGQMGSQKFSAKQSDESSKNDINCNGVDKSSQQKSANSRPKSSEPKTVNAFQRVKIDEVEFVDERLQDNSYWAKDGAETGYGAKAQEVLGQVKGRGFRHEKTKKKRGSYRGGLIDLQSHSIKFNYSDEE